MDLLTREQIEAGIKAVIEAADYDLAKDIEYGEGPSYESLVDVFLKGTKS